MGIDVSSLQELIDHCRESGVSVRAVTLSDKAEEGKLFVAFGHLHINPKDFESLPDKSCDVEIVGITTEIEKALLEFSRKVRFLKEDYENLQKCLDLALEGKFEEMADFASGMDTCQRDEIPLELWPQEYL